MPPPASRSGKGLARPPKAPSTEPCDAGWPYTQTHAGFQILLTQGCYRALHHLYSTYSWPGCSGTREQVLFVAMTVEIADAMQNLHKLMQ